jgi:hypothetical protein
MCQQKQSDGASLWEEKVCPDFPLTKNRPERGLVRLVEFSTMFNGSTYPCGPSGSPSPGQTIFGCFAHVLTFC